MLAPQTSQTGSNRIPTLAAEIREHFDAAKALTRRSMKSESGLRWVKDDGGRKASGYSGTGGDCVVRAIAIATGKPYREVMEALVDKRTRRNKRLLSAGKKEEVRRVRDPDDMLTGCPDQVWEPYLKSIGWTRVNTEQQGIYLRADGGFPTQGKLIVEVSQHLLAMVDGVIHDTHDSAMKGKRSIRAYWTQPGSIADTATLAIQINKEHAACQGALAEGVAHAITAGELLLKAKDKIEHGQWDKWKRANLTFSPRTAQLYMQMAQLDPEKRNGVADLALRRAVLKIQADRRDEERARELLCLPPAAVQPECERPAIAASPPPPPRPDEIADDLIDQLVHAASEEDVDPSCLLEAFRRRFPELFEQKAILAS